MTKEKTKLTASAKGARDFIKAFDGAFIERSKESNALLLALVAELPVVLLGPPGTAKSLLIRKLAEATSGSYFEYLISKFTGPDELFGQYKVSALKKDKLERAYKGTLVDAEFAFLDEIFKASSALLNALLKTLNEKTADVGTGQVPMLYNLLAGASNELPEKGVGLEALWDRWAIRCWVNPIKTDQGFERLMMDDTVGVVTTKLDMEHIAILRKHRGSVDISPVRSMLKVARAKLMDAGCHLSDRKWVMVRKAIRASAVIAGRQAASRSDLAVLNLMAWDDESQIPSVEAVVAEVAQGEAAKIKQLAVDIASLRNQHIEPQDLVDIANKYISTAKDIADDEGWCIDCIANFEHLMHCHMSTLEEYIAEMNSEMEGYGLSEFAEMAKTLTGVGVITTHIKELTHFYKAICETPMTQAVLVELRKLVARNNSIFQSKTNQL